MVKLTVNLSKQMYNLKTQTAIHALNVALYKTVDPKERAKIENQIEQLKKESMKKLFEIVKERDDLQKALKELVDSFGKSKEDLEYKISELERIEEVAENGIDIDKIQIAESVIFVSGNPYGKTSDVTQFHNPCIAEKAIIDIANGCKFLKTNFFGNKTYESFYQGCSCEYGFGPKHGSIVDRIELRNPKKELSDNEKDACIYYLKNYENILVK